MRERRKASRYPLGVVGRLHHRRDRVGGEVLVQVISTLGCALERAEGLSVGEKCELYFQWQNVVVGAAAQVVWKDAIGRMGLKFLSVDRDTQKRLSELCVALSGRPLSTPPRKEAEPARPAAAPAAKPSLPSRHARPSGERERRRVPRYVSELSTQLSNLATGATSTITLVTLSVLGGCMEGSGLPEPGQQCELIAEWEGKTLRIESEVVWKSKEQVGIKFAFLAADAEQLLRQICANLRLQPLAPLPPEPS
jgi:hypothetical protein